jgi:hypothetical protein
MMKAKLFTRAALSAAAAHALVAAPPVLAQVAERVEPRVVVRPRVEIGGGGITIPIFPEIHIDLGQIEIPIPPVPPTPEIEPLPEITGPGIFNDEGFWFGEEQTEREELRQTVALRPGATVELADIDGPVQIDTADSTSAEVVIRSFSAGQNPRKLTFEQTANGFAVRGLPAKQRDRLDSFDRTSHQVRLTLPRRTNLVLTNVTSSVRAGELDGTVKLTNVSGRVGLAQVAGGAELVNVSGAVTLTVERLGGGGVTLSGVTGSVALRFLGGVNADLQTSGVKGKVYVELPNVAVQGEMAGADFRAKVGAGGAPVRVGDVTGTVRLSPARTLAEMLTALRAAGRSAERARAANDLALHVSNPQARRAFVEALNAADTTSGIQSVAARELAPYAREPEVRDAFLRAALNPERNGSVRATAVRALAKYHGGEKSVREQLLRAYAAEKNNSVRTALLGALAGHTDDPAVVRALSDTLRAADQKDSLRLLAAHALRSRVDEAEVFALLVGAARSDARKSVRAMALNALSRRLRDRAELRDLFVGYLDDESAALQYQALKGLVDLGDPALKQRLVEKSRELILLNARRGWNDRAVLAALILLRKLDPQEADRALAQLETARAGAF